MIIHFTKGKGQAYNPFKSIRKKRWDGWCGVTVCVAALCEGGVILGASDRMLTSSDVEFEPPQPKIFVLTKSIVVLMAGDSSLQLEILYRLQAEVNRRIDANPTQWLKVSDMAELYAEYYRAVRAKRAETQILAPLGLTHATFLSQQNQMDPALVTRLAEELINFDISTVEAILTGVDETGSHIYVVENSTVACKDFAGFAAIGVGYWHANSQFMFAGHARWKPLSDTLLLTYSAKKRAEVAPGVGQATDMFTIGPSLGSYTTIREEIIEQIGKMYAGVIAGEKLIQKKARDKAGKYVEKILEETTTKEQPALPEDTLANKPPDGEATSDPKTESGKED